jgi:murein DD-endopeptidase MepM/ murein hydrolase activator NlpD
LALIPLNVDIQAGETIVETVEQSQTRALEPSALLASSRVVTSNSNQLPTINEVVTHVVESGETLSALSEQYLVPSDAIAYVNNISVNALLHPGDTLTIPPVQGLTHNVKSGETVGTIAEKYNVSPQAIVDANVLKPPFNIYGGDVLVIPGGEVPKPVPQQPVVLATNEVGTAPVSGGLSLESVPGSGGYIMPTGGKITQYASYYHMALDIAKGCGDEIWASQSGSVVYSGWRAGGYGFMVELVHPDGRISQYAHMSRTAVSVGQAVSQGQVIGYTGATGIAYGCHLHFVVQSGGRAINPLDVL